MPLVKSNDLTSLSLVLGLYPQQSCLSTTDDGDDGIGAFDIIIEDNYSSRTPRFFFALAGPTMSTSTLTTTKTSNGGLPPTTVLTTKSSTSASKEDAYLTATILSAYDLPVREPPSYVTIQVGNRIVKTGPPAQRHKDRNSFKFNRESVTLYAPSLPDLYSGTAIVTVAYPNQNTSIQAEYSLQQLKIHETVWLILELSGDAATDPTAVAPTIRLQFTLSGPFRPEIGFIVNVFQGWFKCVDLLTDSFSHSTSGATHWLTHNVDPKLILIPAVPLVATLVVSAPVWIGFITVTLPLALPVLAAVGGVLGVLLVVMAIVYASTRSGRSAVGSVLCTPIVNTLLSTQAGQTALYQTGPRPTPVSVARVVLPNGVWGKLLVSLLVDGLGSASYLLPVVGEVTDLGWAPLQTMLIMALYEHSANSSEAMVSQGEWLKYVSFVEEIMPFTDIVPTATVGWFLYCGLPHWRGETPTVEATKTSAPRRKKPTTRTVYEQSAASNSSRAAIPVQVQSKVAALE